MDEFCLKAQDHLQKHIIVGLDRQNQALPKESMFHSPFPGTRQTKVMCPWPSPGLLLAFSWPPPGLLLAFSWPSPTPSDLQQAWPWAAGSSQPLVSCWGVGLQRSARWSRCRAVFPHHQDGRCCRVPTARGGAGRRSAP